MNSDELKHNEVPETQPAGSAQLLLKRRQARRQTASWLPSPILWRGRIPG